MTEPRREMLFQSPVDSVASPTVNQGEIRQLGQQPSMAPAVLEQPV